MSHQALSDSDAIVWIVERDPALRSTIIGLVVLDRAPDLDELRYRVERASRFVPKLRQVVVATTPDGGSPMWVTKSSIDLEYHVRHVRLPAPGHWEDLLTMAEQAAMAAFDPVRPLWEATLVEGLEDGRAVLVMKIHHAITDGLGSFQIAAHLLDFEQSAAADAEGLPPPPQGDASSALALALAAASQRLRLGGVRLLKAVELTTERVRAAASDPASVLDALGAVPAVARFLAPASTRRSPLFAAAEHSLSWRLWTIEVPLADLKRAARAVGASVNDAFLGIIAGALRQYHEELGAPTEAVRVTMPVNIRRGGDAEAGNRFTPLRFDLPLTVRDPAARLQAMRDLSRTKRSDPALGYTDALAAALNSLPAAVITSVFGSMLKGVDIVVSNVPGSPVPLFLAGAEVVRIFPFAPPSGAALSVTLVSHVDTCCIGVQVDPAAVTDFELLDRCLRDSIDEVLALAAAPAASTTRRKARASRK